MKIIKVLVDELPSKCVFCSFSRLESIKAVLVFGCNATDKIIATTKNEYSLEDIDRPDWCPLKVDDE